MRIACPYAKVIGKRRRVILGRKVDDIVWKCMVDGEIRSELKMFPGIPICITREWHTCLKLKNKLELKGKGGFRGLIG